MLITTNPVYTALIYAIMLHQIPNGMSDSDTARYNNMPTEVMQQIYITGVAMQLVDQRETVFWTICDTYADSSYYKISNLNSVHERYIESLKEPLPFVEEFTRWKLTPEKIGQLKDFNQEFTQHLRCYKLQSINGGDRDRLCDEAIKETQRLYEVYDTLGDTQQDIYYVFYRREALKKLRNLIGYEAYYNGRLPPVVPLEYFEELPP